MVALISLFSKAVNMGILVNHAQARTAMMSTGHRGAVKCAMIIWILTPSAQAQPLSGPGPRPSAVLPQQPPSHLQGCRVLVSAVLQQLAMAG